MARCLAVQLAIFNVLTAGCQGTLAAVDVTQDGDENWNAKADQHAVRDAGVAAVSDPPALAEFRASAPVALLDAPTEVTWRWSFEADSMPARECIIDHGVGPVTQGTTSVISVASDTTYTLTCRNEAGASTATTTVHGVTRPIVIKDFDFSELTVDRETDTATDPATGVAHFNTVAQLQEAPTAVGEHIYLEDRAMRFEVDFAHPRPYNDPDIGDTHRSEARTRFEGFERETWFAISYYFPEEFRTDPVGEVIMQTFGLTGEGLAHGVSLKSINGELILRIGKHDLPRIYISLGATPLGERVDFVFKMNSAPDDSAYVMLWMNNELVAEHRDLIISPSASDGIVEYKWGLYKGWRGHTPTGDDPTNRVLYVTHVRWAHAEAPDHVTYSAVHPDGARALSGIEYPE